MSSRRPHHDSGFPLFISFSYRRGSFQRQRLSGRNVIVKGRDTNSFYRSSRLILEKEVVMTHLLSVKHPTNIDRKKERAGEGKRELLVVSNIDRSRIQNKRNEKSTGSLRYRGCLVRVRTKSPQIRGGRSPSTFNQHEGLPDHYSAPAVSRRL